LETDEKVKMKQKKMQLISVTVNHEEYTIVTRRNNYWLKALGLDKLGRPGRNRPTRVKIKGNGRSKTGFAGWAVG